MKKIGITGSTGLLGKLLTKELRNKNIKYSVFKGDIHKNKDIRAWFNRSKNIEYIFHFAAHSSASGSEINKKKVYKLNVRGVENLIFEMNKIKRKFFLFFPSTSHVYKYSKKPLNEKSKLKPNSYYGKTKLIAEEKIILNKNKNFNYLIARIFSVFHKNQKKPFLYASIRDRMKNNSIKKIYIKNANCIRDFLNAEKVVEIIYQIYRKKLMGVLNIGSGEGISIKDFIYKEITNKKEVVSDKKVDYLVANIDKLKKQLIQNKSKLK